MFLYLTTPSISSSPPSLPNDSPLPVIQRPRVGVEFNQCIRIESGAPSDSLLYCRAGVVFKPSILHTLFHPRQPAINFSFLSRHSSLSLSPGYDYRNIICPSLPRKISIVCRARQPSTSYHSFLQTSAVDEFIIIQYPRAVHMICWK